MHKDVTLIAPDGRYTACKEKKTEIKKKKKVVDGIDKRR